MNPIKKVRFIGITHRIKQTADGEAHPTLVTIIDGTKIRSIELATEDDELDFLLGHFPTNYRPADISELNVLIPIFSGIDVPKSNLLTVKGIDIRLHQIKGKNEKIRIPCEFDGLQLTDVIGMCRGGSGDRLAAAFSRRLESLGHQGYVQRITSALLKDEREKLAREKNDDCLTLAELIRDKPNLFQLMGPKERNSIRLNEAFIAREESLKAHLAAEQRLRTSMIGRIFLSENGHFPEGSIEEAFDLERANDIIVAALKKERDRRDSDLEKIMQSLPIWKEVFEPIPGCGRRIAAGIWSAIGDISRFANDAKLKAFCGVHVLEDGIFPRKRRGQRCNWNPRARQSLYLLGDQFNRRKNTPWNDKLQEYKKKLREKHPEPIKTAEGKTLYSDGHIHKMAIWKTLTKFVEFLYREAKRIEEK